MSDTAVQQELFHIEGNIAPRLMVREYTKNTEWLKKVDIDRIKIRPDNFNGRIKPPGMSEEMWEQVLMIPDLADKIHANNGPAEPVLGDFVADGFFYINNGERRTRAMKHLIATGRDTYPNGEPVSEVVVLMNPPGTTDLERKLKMYNTNDTLPFSPMQKCRYFLSFKNDPYNLPNEEIAKLFPKVSRQTVDNYIMCATELPEHIQEQIDKGEVKMTNALAEHRKAKADARKSKSAPAGEDEEPIITGALADKLQEEEKDKEKLRGDEDEFEQQDNSVNFGGSRHMGEDKSSNAVVLGKDSIYMHEQRKSCVKQLLNRIHTLNEKSRQLIVADKPSDEEDEERAAILYGKRQDYVIDQLVNEYDITVK